MRQYLTVVQIVNRLKEINLASDIINSFVIGQCKHRLRQNIHILILYASAIIGLVFILIGVIIGNHDFPIIVHVLIGLLAGLFIGSSRRLFPILNIQLSFQHLKFVFLRTFQISSLAPGLRTVLITGQKIRILSQYG